MGDEDMAMRGKTIIQIQQQPFDLASVHHALSTASAGVGAVATFTGVCRNRNDGQAVSDMHLEHYPGMTERSIGKIVDSARDRFAIMDCTVIHRVGALRPGDQIVLVAVSSAHRGEAFSACEFIMDYLKTRAPFWKKEITEEGERWVDARNSDDEARERWEQ